MWGIQLFRGRLSEKNVHATIPKGIIWDMINTVPDDCSCRTYFCCFPLALANIRPWPLVPFFQISLKNSELKTTHDTFRDCRVHFFRQPFSKYLYREKSRACNMQKETPKRPPRVDRAFSSGSDFTHNTLNNIINQAI